MTALVKVCLPIRATTPCNVLDPDTKTAINVDTRYAQGAAYVEGSIVPIGEARIPITDWGFTRSDVTYDVVHVWQGRFFRLEDHLQRFERSCAALRLDPQLSRAQMRTILLDCVRRCALRDAYVEMICTRGQAPPGSRDPRLCENRFYAFAIPSCGYCHQKSKRAVAICISPTSREFHRARSIPP